MLGSMLIGLDSTNHGASLVELAIRWGRPFGATLVGLGIVDEPGIRAIEPAWPVGGTPGKDPVYYMGYDARMAEVERQVEQRLEQFAARCGEAGTAHLEIKAIGSPADLIEREAQSCDLILMARGLTSASSLRTTKATRRSKGFEEYFAPSGRGPRDLSGGSDRHRL